MLLCLDHRVGHDGGAGVSPDGWLPDRVTVGALTKVFPPELVDRVIASADARQERTRLLPARLMDLPDTKDNRKVFGGPGDRIRRAHHHR